LMLLVFSLTSLNGGPIAIPLAAKIIVPVGRGEHQQPDDQDNTADGTHGPDEDQHRQEIVTDTEPGCRVHIYAIADTYNASATLHLIANDNAMTISLDSFQLDWPAGWSRDGCSLQEMLPIAGAIAGSLFGGLAGSALGAAAGFVAGGDLDNLVISRVNAVIVEKMQSLQGSWRIQT
jgi:hypothetical protein